MMSLSQSLLSITVSTLFGLSMIGSVGAASGKAIRLSTEDGHLNATIVVEKGAPGFTRAAAEKVALYIEKISGAKPVIAHETAGVKTGSIIWVGPHRELGERHPGVDLLLTMPEETVIQTVDKDVIILGRDRYGANGEEIEAGTYLAATSFIEDQLGVRWFWPGDLGTDIPKRREIVIEPTSARYTPQLRLRRFNMTNFKRGSAESKDGKRGLSKESRNELKRHVGNISQWAVEKDRETREWLNHHRGDAPPTGSTANALAGSMASYRNRHAFQDWYSLYGAEHPDWFALQPDGTRTPYPSPRYAKLCISNPGVAEQWLANAKAYFIKNPDATTFESGENDYGWQGYCVCANCVALDNKDAELLEAEIRWKDKSERSYALTDRYAKFWNNIARRLKEGFPDRDVNVATYAYHVTRPAPTQLLEPNIIPAYVGIERRFYHINNRATTLDQRRIWKGWWEAVGRKNSLVWRPNIMARSIGLPYLFTKRHAENMRFMADHGLVGVTFNSNHSYWAVEGPQLYLNAKLLWNPRADEEKVLSDYYERAFGPAGPHMANYFAVFENLYGRLAEEYGEYGYSVLGDPPRLFREIRSESEKATGRLGQEGVKRHRRIEEKAAEHLQAATDAVAEGDSVFRDRVEFMKVGFAYIQAHLDSIEAMNDYTDKPSEENRKRAEEASERRLAILRQNAGSFALNYVDALLLSDKNPEYLGPPHKIDPKRDRKREAQKLTQDLGA